MVDPNTIARRVRLAGGAAEALTGGNYVQTGRRMRVTIFL
jgi:hypothetical protein